MGNLQPANLNRPPRSPHLTQQAIWLTDTHLLLYMMSHVGQVKRSDTTKRGFTGTASQLISSTSNAFASPNSQLSAKSCEAPCKVHCDMVLCKTQQSTDFQSSGSPWQKHSERDLAKPLA